jgi:hypothetical protein
MKTFFNQQNLSSAALGLGLLLAQSALGQTELKFTGVSQTDERAIRLAWASQSNEVYQIQCADALAGNEDGSTAWQTLYDEYPSQGTNTFWLDTGDYKRSPYILHPKYMAMRFYRAVMTGVNDGANPTISVTVPTNAATVSGDLTVTVSITSDQPVVRSRLYVDGEEMPSSDDGTNYVINTCEWPNGNHTLFAVAKAQSGYEGFPNDRSVTYGRSASPYVNVTFDNLITKIAFSEPFFEPALGQTQKVTATFTANSDWTLQIRDEDDNTVRNASGSGSSLSFAWDGNGDGGTNIPDGVYTYIISAQTNGLANMSMVSSGNRSLSSAAALSATYADVIQLWALTPDGSGPPIPLVIYPPGTDTNGFDIFEASQSEIQALTKVVNNESQPLKSAKPVVLLDSASGGESPNIMDATTPTDQTTTAPERPPTKKVKGQKGKYGIAYLQYLPAGFTGHGPPTGMPYPLTQYIAVDGHSANGNVDDAQVIVFKDTAEGFMDRMENAGWKRGFVHANTNFTPADLKKTSLGGNGIFNTVNIGITMTHGSYGTTTTASDPVLNTYWWFGANNFVKLADCSFGSAGTNGLRWMALLGCNLLRDENYQSMYNHLKLQINNNLHLLLGARTFSGATDDIGKLWATKMTRSVFLGGPKSVWQSWYEAGREAYAGATNIDNGPWAFRAAGWPNCFGDTLKEYEDPNSGNPANITYQDQQVWP